jgi:ADP-ribosyl-[dinitrogen reductase] hydrolase
MSSSKSIRTSASHPLQINTLNLFNKPLIGLSFCPGKIDEGMFTGCLWQRDLEIDAAAVVKWGATIWLNLMEDEDLRAVKLDPELFANTVRSNNMTYIHFPIIDQGVPDAEGEVRWKNEISPLLKQYLERGEKLFIHCRGGLGRTGIMAAKLLIDLGEAMPDEAILLVRQARPHTIETQVQEDWVRDQLFE